MSTAEAIVAWVKDDGATSALIGARIHPVVLPASPEFPAVTYQLVSEQPEMTQDGPTLTDARWRITVWAERYRELAPIAEAIGALFDARHDGPFLTASVESSIEDHDVRTGRWRRVLDVVALVSA